MVIAMEFIVEGKPQGKARARTFYNKNIGRMQSITPEQTKDYESLIRWSYKAAGGQYLNDSNVEISIAACYEIPKSYSKAKRQAALSGELRPTTKPDVDNIIKVVLDALNGVAYYDDKQVVYVSCEKHYSDHGHLKIYIKEL